MVDLQCKIHEKGHTWVIRLYQPDGFLREEKVVILARIISSIAGFICAPQVCEPLTRHLEQCARPGTMLAVSAVRFCATVVDGSRVRFCDGAPAVLALRRVVWLVTIPVVWRGAHAINAVARGEMVHSARLVMKACVEATARRQHIVGCIAEVPLDVHNVVIEEQVRNDGSERTLEE